MSCFLAHNNLVQLDVTKSLRKRKDTNIYKLQDTEKFENRIRDINWDSEVVRPEVFEDSLKIINRRFNYALKMQVISAYQNGEIVTIYPADDDLSKLVPIFLVMGKEKNVVSVINLRLYCYKDKDGNFNLDEKKLYSLLEEAYINLQLYRSPNKFVMSTKLLNISTTIYVKMMNKVLDKLYAINLQPEWSDRINFLLAKFFLIYVIEKPVTEALDSIAYATVFNETSLEA